MDKLVHSSLPIIQSLSFIGKLPIRSFNKGLGEVTESTEELDMVWRSHVHTVFTDKRYTKNKGKKQISTCKWTSAASPSGYIAIKVATSMSGLL